MNNKMISGIIISALTAVVVLIATTYTSKGIDSIDAGSEALTKESIRVVLEEELEKKLVTTDGKTYGQQMTENTKLLVRMEAQLETLQRAVERASTD